MSRRVSAVGRRAGDGAASHLEQTITPDRWDGVQKSAAVPTAPGPTARGLTPVLPAATLLAAWAAAWWLARGSAAAPVVTGTGASVLALIGAAGLRRAVARDEFRVVYQPPVDMGTGGVSGVEALVRWHHPDHGVVVPVEFIPLAESTGLIDAIGAFVLREACQQVATWRAEVPGAEQMRLSVNLSGHQLHDPGLVSAVVEALGASGLPATSLVLEVTESVFVGQDDAALEVLEALRSLGVRLAIDDFGTGYSSLSHLHRLPVDIITIDKSFVDRLSDAGELSLVDAIVGMADVLGLVTVAEGVEHEHQRAALAAQGCTTGQGYHFSPPVEPHLLPELVVGALPARPVPVPGAVPEAVDGSAGA